MRLEASNDLPAGSVVAVGMSGGVDSSVAALLLRDAGAAVMGVTAIMTREESKCCSQEDVVRARVVADQLGFEHHVVDVQEEFRSSIIDYFQNEYLAGRTPSPCVWCNPLIKFGAMYRKMCSLGVTHIATGHYATVARNGDGIAELWRGRDKEKEQSYFLARLSREQLNRTVLPLGGMTKPDVVAIAHQHGLATRASRESQDLCFIMDGDHGLWIDAQLAARSRNSAGPGDIVDMAGRKLGEHRGVHHYTIGQRRGLGIAAGYPVFVARIEAGSNRLVVGTREDAMTDRMRVDDLSWLCRRAPEDTVRASIQIRYNHAAAPATVRLSGDRAADVLFDQEQFAVTPGQWAAFYDGDRVLGGGWIAGE